jgi:predicted PurR-regulated permease PerM
LSDVLSKSTEGPGPARTGPPATTPAEQSFARRALIAVGIALGVAALAVFLWYSMYALLLAFAAVLVGVLLRGAADWVATRSKIGRGAALIIVVLSLLGFFVLLGVFAAPSLVQQAEALVERVPQGLRQADEKLRSYSWGRRLLGEEPPDAAGAGPATRPASRPSSQPASRPSTQPDPPSEAQPAAQPTLVGKVVDAGTGSAAVKQATRIINTVVTSVLTLFVVLVTGIYLAAQPGMYVNGVVKLAPHARRARYREVLARLGHTLRWWMIGQLVPMAVIGTLTAIGLKVIGVPMWLFLGLLAGLFNFIPNFGPLISGVPAYLLALSESPTKAMWVVLLYVIAQSLEGYVLTPLVQRRAVEMPPALLILFQVLAGLLLGALGVVLAAPLLAVALVAIRMLYVEDVLGDKADVPGEGDDGPAPAPPEATTAGV